MKLITLKLKLAINNFKIKRAQRAIYKSSLRIRRLERNLKMCDRRIQIMEIAERN
jgi:hypothetical protein